MNTQNGNRKYPDFSVSLQGTFITELLGIINSGHQLNQDIAFTEIILERLLGKSESLMNTIKTIAQVYPIMLHSVGINIGGKIVPNQLSEVKKMISFLDPKWISVHLAQTGSPLAEFHGLLPLSYNKETLLRVKENLAVLENTLDLPVLIENITAYADRVDSTWTQGEFLDRLLEISPKTRLLLDLNNLFINSCNDIIKKSKPTRHEELLEEALHKSEALISQIDIGRVSEVHLAGYGLKAEASLRIDHDLYIDTHGSNTDHHVVALLRTLVKRGFDGIVTLEREANIPNYASIIQEIREISSCIHSVSEPL